MTYENERRHSTRHDIKASIIYFLFTSLPTDNYDAKVINSSNYGICFQSRWPLKPRQCVCIRKKHDAEDDIGLSCEGGIKELSLAEILWCKEYEDRSKTQYNIGVKYL